MNNKFQEIIETPAMSVPAMSTKEIHITILEASLEYVKGTLDLSTLVTIAKKIQYFMGLRAEDSRSIENMLTGITELASNLAVNKKVSIFIDAMLLESVNEFSTNASLNVN